MERCFKISGFADEMAGDLTTQIAGLTKLGMHFIEMRGIDGKNLIEYNNEKVKEIKERLDAADIHLSAIGSPIGKIGITDDFEPHFESLKRTIEIAHQMNTENIRMFSFYLPHEALASDWESAVFERMGKMVDYATKNDIVLLHENEKGIYGEKSTECMKLMETFYGNHFKAIFDFANFVQAGENTLEGYKLMKPYITYIHVKDAMLNDGKVVPVGYGDGHVKEILADLFKSGFDGYLSLEPHLFNFAGFAALEKDGISMQKADNKIMSGTESFEVAHRALMRVLSEI